MSNLLVQNIKHTNNTQSIAVDTSGNVTASGNVTTTGNTSVGGTLTSTGTLTASGDLHFNSDFGSSGKAYGVRAWASFNGASTVSIHGSGNVSSNYASNMPDGDYAVTLGDNNWGNTIHEENLPTSNARILNMNNSFSNADTQTLSMIVVR
jgi:hypothetical protein